jgi:hypothetical protein
MEIKEIIPNLNKRVRWRDNDTYTMTGCTIRRNKEGQICYSAELLDKNGNSVCIVRLEEVEKYE